MKIRIKKNEIRKTSLVDDPEIVLNKLKTHWRAYSDSNVSSAKAKVKNFLILSLSSFAQIWVILGTNHFTHIFYILKNLLARYN